MNKIILSGRLTKDFADDVRTFDKKGGQGKVLKTSIAVYRDKDNTDFVNITFFDRNVDRLLDGAKKGARILVYGRLQIENYEDKDGNKRVGTKVIAEQLEIMDYTAKEKHEVSENDLPFEINPNDLPF